MGVKEVSFIESLILHRRPECLSGCIDILCEEWGRSRTARSVMLEKSCDEFPFNIALVEWSAGYMEVIGHSRLCVVVGSPRSAFVESVVIKKSKRGTGLGRKLMDETEKHALNLGIETLYLTTTDKQDFYKHMGFTFCHPIISLGSASKLLTNIGFQNLFGHQLASSLVSEETLVGNGEPSNMSPFVPPPLPPPLMPNNTGVNKIMTGPTSGGPPQIVKVDVNWMKKSLCN